MSAEIEPLVALLRSDGIRTEAAFDRALALDCALRAPLRNEPIVLLAPEDVVVSRPRARNTKSRAGGNAASGTDERLARA